LTICSFCCSNLLIEGLKTGTVKLVVINTLKKTETTGTTDGKTGGDKFINKKTETTGTTNGKTRGDKHNIKRLEQKELFLLFQSFYWRAYYLQFYHQ
jgi:hypothetical protein